MILTFKLVVVLHGKKTREINIYNMLCPGEVVYEA